MTTARLRGNNRAGVSWAVPLAAATIMVATGAGVALLSRGIDPLGAATGARLCRGLLESFGTGVFADRLRAGSRRRACGRCDPARIETGRKHRLCPLLDRRRCRRMRRKSIPPHSQRTVPCSGDGCGTRRRQRAVLFPRRSALEAALRHRRKRRRNHSVPSACRAVVPSYALSARASWPCESRF